MSRMIISCIGVGVAATVFLSGCVTVTPDPVAIGPYPVDWKGVVISYAKDAYFDPYSIRDAEVSSPRQGHLFFQQGWIVCLKANAKNRMGGYVGRRTSALLINHGKVINTMEDAPLCKSVSYQPFHELENL